MSATLAEQALATEESQLLNVLTVPRAPGIRRFTREQMIIATVSALTTIVLSVILLLNHEAILEL